MKKLFIVGTILGLFASGLTAGETAVLDLPLSASIEDQSNTKNITTLVGSATIKDNALVIGAKKSYLNAGTKEELNMDANSITIVSTFKLSGTQEDRSGIVSKGAGSSKNAGYAFMYRLPKKAFFFYVSDGEKRWGFQSNTDNLNDEKWHTVAVSFNRAGEVIFALDGKIRGKRDASMVSKSAIVDKLSSVSVGAWGNSFCLMGSMKNVRVYKESFNANQLTEMTGKK